MGAISGQTRPISQRRQPGQSQTPRPRQRLQQPAEPIQQLDRDNIRTAIAPVTAKTIFHSRERAVEYLHQLAEFREQPWDEFSEQALDQLNTRRALIPLAYDLVQTTWDYDDARQVIRQMFRQSKKYQRGCSADQRLEAHLAAWQEQGLGPVKWPVSQGNFDRYLQTLNAQEESSAQQKDVQAADSAIRLRRLKEINTARNDYLEAVVFDQSEHVIPTFHHSRGVDFFIHGQAIDQKVSRSVTREFQNDFGDDWRQVAQAHPEQVARYLYQYQDEGRFSDQPQLQLVLLDEDIPAQELVRQVQQLDFAQPQLIEFDYQHHGAHQPRHYTTSAYTLLLTNAQDSA